MRRDSDGTDGSTALAPIRSPDGMNLLFTRVAPDQLSLWTIDTSGGGGSRLTDLPNVESIGYAWGAAAP
jgi:Tol biopolymer transport system component